MKISFQLYYSLCLRMLRFVLLIATLDVYLLFQAAEAEKFLRCSCIFDDLQDDRFNVLCNRSLTEVAGASEVICSSERKRGAPKNYQALIWSGAESFSSLYRVFRTARVWEDAVAACARDGATLAVSETQGEFLEVLKFLQKSRQIDAYIGLRRSNSKSAFRTMQGNRADFDYKAWASGQPSTRRGFNCAVLHDGAGDAGGYVASNCSRLNPFICEWKLELQVPKNYLYFPGKGFYSVGTEITTFDKASRFCERDGGHIVVVDNEEEAALVMQAFDMYPGETRVYVGIKWERDQYYTVLGEPASMLQFQNWELQSLEEECVVFTRIGTLKTTNCKKLLPFICERTENY